MDKNISRRKYKNSPIIEAVCEIEFSESQSDPTIWGLFHNRITDKYPNKQTGERYSLERKVNDDPASIEIVKTDSMRFFNNDKSELVQLSEDLLTISVLKSSYEGFEAFRDNVIMALEAYCELAKPAFFEQLRLRYINKISIPGEAVLLHEYFNYFPVIRNKEFHRFHLKVEIESFHQEHTTFIALSSAPDHGEDNCDFVVDINDLFSSHNELNLHFIVDVLNQAHENVGRIFEAVITDKTRSMFQEMKDDKCDW